MHFRELCESGEHGLVERMKERLERGRRQQKTTDSRHVRLECYLYEVLELGKGLFC